MGFPLNSLNPQEVKLLAEGSVGLCSLGAPLDQGMSLWRKPHARVYIISDHQGSQTASKYMHRARSRLQTGISAPRMCPGAFRPAMSASNKATFRHSELMEAGKKVNLKDDVPFHNFCPKCRSPSHSPVMGSLRNSRASLS